MTHLKQLFVESLEIFFYTNGFGKIYNVHFPFTVKEMLESN